MTAKDRGLGGPDRRLPTASGARIVPVSADAAAAFLARTDVRGPEETWVALAALEDSYPDDAVAADALIRGSGLVTARKVLNGTVTTVMFLPEATFNPHR